MRIVFLDSHLLNPGDLSWDPIIELGEIVFHERTLPGQVIEHARDADIIVTNTVGITAEDIKALPKLKFICLTATGFDHIALDYAAEKNIPVSNSPAYSTYSVAQTAIALLLHMTQHISEHSQAVSRGAWSKSPDNSFWLTPLHELKGKVLGVIGYGAIGRQAAAAARALGMEILAHHTDKENIGLHDEVEWTDLHSLLSRCDVLSLHCPLNPGTRKIINSTTLNLMKESALIINTARGGLIDEEALAEALNNDRIAGAGLDVLEQEPPPMDHPLLRAKNCYVTPHIGWATVEARRGLMEIAGNSIQSFLAGKPIHVVNPKQAAE